MNRKALLVVLAVLVAGGGLLAAWSQGLFSDDPEEVSLANSTDAPSGDGEIAFDGTWNVAASDDTFAGYRIEEEFAGLGTNTAVGRTNDVDGSMTIDGDTIEAVDLTIDMTTLRSDRDMRDNALRDRGLETDTYPEATFELTEPITGLAAPGENEQIEAEATGDFTLHGVTKQVTIPLEAKWTGDNITVVSSFDVDLDDYGIERPTTARVVSIADTGTVEFQAVFEKAA